MERSLWTAATGMNVQQRNMENIANNLANVNTTGFKRGRAEFQDLMYQTLIAPGTSSSTSTRVPSGIQVGLGARTAAVRRLFQQGQFKGTDNPFDVVISGKGFFQINRPDGQTVYTRDGTFSLNENGTIVNSQGFELDPPLTIPPEATAVTIAADGTVSAKLSDGSTSEIGNILLADFINPAGLGSIGNNLYEASPSSGDPIIGTPGQDGVGELLQGHLELSNVSIVSELVDMISAQRAYELNSRSIRSADEMLRSLSQLVR